ncbi:DUF2971 domain-containing protein [Dickeya oryzae]|uniref:DUF2971 domain-containing protein n=1 Tax=Dickeya oryzae TaxID=1240404 RepID=A0AB39IN04_9GAMM|nr:DUF2971 domain-containing protein [Dickeya oryzae]MCA6990785.1 DUF2971 domain-containing protein [Dickeya oryzae]
MIKGFSFYKYVNKKDALLIINNGTLFFTNPLNFNDPFDVFPCVPKEGLSKYYKYILRHHNILPDVHGKKKKSTLNNINIDDMRAEFSKKWAVTCFSKSPFILPLWAHYADNHKGCVLEFRVNSAISNYIVECLDKGCMDNEVIYPLDVVYSKKRPRLYDKDGIVTGEIAQNIILTKDEAWSYEQEMRCFRENKQGAYPFRKDQFNRIYLGMKMNEKDVAEVTSAVKRYQEMHGHVVKIDTVSLDREEFKMTKL